MCGVTSEITSPSVRSTSRKTPCVLGCCGPMLTSISSVRTSNSMTVWSSGVWRRAVSVTVAIRETFLRQATNVRVAEDLAVRRQQGYVMDAGGGDDDLVGGVAVERR